MGSGEDLKLRGSSDPVLSANRGSAPSLQFPLGPLLTLLDCGVGRTLPGGDFLPQGVPRSPEDLVLPL